MEFGFPIGIPLCGIPLCGISLCGIQLCGIPLCGIKGLAIAQFRVLKTLNGIYRGKNKIFDHEHIGQNINEHR